MKKISIKIVISILMFFCVTTNFFAVGAGFTVGATPSIAFDTITEKQDISTDFLFSAAGNIRGSRIPFVFAMGIEAGFLNKEFSLGANLNFDYWVIDSQLKNTWSIYSGCGLAANILFDFNSNMNFGFGPKFFVGVNKIPRLFGSGMLVINAPYLLKENTEPVIAYLEDLLKVES